MKRRFHIQPPSGPSTQAGRAARQAVMLNREGEPLVCGWIDFPAQTCEIKNFELLSTAYRQRYAKQIELKSSDHTAFVANLREVLDEFGITLTLLKVDDEEDTKTELVITTSLPDEDEVDEPLSSAGSMRLIIVALVSLLLGIGLTLATVMLLRR